MRPRANGAHATAALTHVYADFPVSPQSSEAGIELRRITGNDPLLALSDAQKLSRADLLYKAHHYSEAAQEMRTLLNLPVVSSAQNTESAASVRDYTVRYAGALYKANRKSEAMDVIRGVSEQPLDEAGAERLYLLAEDARAKDDGDGNRRLVQQLATAVPQSPWTQEALLSSANMYLLRKDYPQASAAFLELASVAPAGRYAGYAHWKGAWLSYRMGDKDASRRLFLEQIANWPAGQEVPAALFWAGRLARQQNRPEEAKAYFSHARRTLPPVLLRLPRRARTRRPPVRQPCIPSRAGEGLLAPDRARTDRCARRRPPRPEEPSAHQRRPL